MDEGDLNCAPIYAMSHYVYELHILLKTTDED
jgi:hypothetical protein